MVKKQQSENLNHSAVNCLNIFVTFMVIGASIYQNSRIRKFEFNISEVKMKTVKTVTSAIVIILTTAIFIGIITIDAASSGKSKDQVINNVISSETLVEQTKKEPVKLEDCLFIGDSRTVGLYEFSSLKDADFFANVGMSVYNISKAEVYNKDGKRITLLQMLQEKQYKKVFIMLGINEVGYHFDTTVGKYKELVDFIREHQKNTQIVIQSNLHVTSDRSKNDKTVNNQNIDRFNAVISQLADGINIIYLDANKIFDDENGDLSKEYASDHTHLKVSNYEKWSALIKEEALIIP